MPPRALHAAAFVFVLIALIAGCKGPGGSTTPPPPAVSQFLADAHLGGQVVLLQFSNVDFDCQKSREGLDAMIAMSRSKTIAGLICVRVEGSADDDRVNEYFASKSCGFTIWRDKDGSVTKAFQATVLPTVALVDKFGRVRYRGGFPDEKQLAEWTAQLVVQKEDAGADVTLFGTQTMKLSEQLAATKLPDLNGEVKPLADYRDRGGLLVIFADISCPYVNAALGELPTVARTLSLYRIPVVVVNIGDAKEDVLSTYAARNTGTPVIFDETNATQENWKVESVPTLVFVNANGQLGYRSQGAVWSNLAEAVDTSLGLTPGTVTFTVIGSGGG